MKIQQKQSADAKYSLPPRSENELRNALSDFVSNSAINLAHNNKISKKALIALLGFPQTAAFREPPKKWKWILPILSEYQDRLLTQKKADTASKKNELRQKIEKLYQTNNLPLYRGKIARNPLQKLLSYPPAALLQHNKNNKWGWAREVVDEFDVYLRNEKGHGTVWEEKIPEIKKLLIKLEKTNDLPINNKGKLNRSAILKQFGLGDNSANIAQSRAPLLKIFLDAFDEQIQGSQYTPYKYAHLENKLKKILDHPDLKLTHGRFISTKWICKKLGINHSNSINNTPQLKILLDLKQKEIDLQCRRGKTKKSFNISGVTQINVGATPYSQKHQRIFNFNCVTESFSLEFSEKLGTCFLLIIENMQSGAKQYYSRLVHFLNWLIRKKTTYPDIISKLSKSKLPKKVEFEHAFLTYAQEVRTVAQKKSPKTDRQGKNINFTIIKKLSTKGIFPDTSYPITKRRSSNNDREARQSLVEAEFIDKDTGQILNIIEDAAVYRNFEFSVNRDTKAFAVTLAKERLRREDLTDSLPVAIRILCDERLNALKEVATETFNEWEKSYSEGNRLIESAKYSSIEILKILEEAKCKNTGYAWNMAIAAIFPRHDPDIALCNLLSLIKHRFNSICPSSSRHEWGQTWNKIYRKVGGMDFVQKHLAPTRMATSAATCLYLCESGANVAVGLAMESSALRASSLPKHVNIVSHKARSAGKPIYYDLPVDSSDGNTISAVHALTLLGDASSPLRSLQTVHSDKLTLYASQGFAKVLTEWQLRDDVKAMSTMSELLSDYRIVPSMIRPTVLLSAQLKNPTNLGVAQQIAQHESESTTMGYVRKLPYRLILEERIRKFTDTVQLVIASNLSNAETKLGIDKQLSNELYKNARKTGLGTFCANPYGGMQPDYPKGTPCKAIDRCITCDKMIVVAEPTSMSDMIIWNESLSIAENEWLEKRYTRWQDIWVPWQAFFHVVLNEKMARGELAAIKSEASLIVEKRKALPDFKRPEPW